MEARCIKPFYFDFFTVDHFIFTSCPQKDYIYHFFFKIFDHFSLSEISIVWQNYFSSQFGWFGFRVCLHGLNWSQIFYLIWICCSDNLKIQTELIIIMFSTRTLLCSEPYQLVSSLTVYVKLPCAGIILDSRVLFSDIITIFLF